MKNQELKGIGFLTFNYKKLTIPMKGIESGKIRNRNVFVHIMRKNKPIWIPSKNYPLVNTFGFDINMLSEVYVFRKEASKMVLTEV